MHYSSALCPRCDESLLSAPVGGDALPESIALPRSGLPEPDRAVLYGELSVPRQTRTTQSQQEPAEEQRTTSARKHLAIRAVFDTVNRAVVTLEHFPLFASDIVYAHPLVACATRDEPVLQDRMDRR